MAKPWATSGLDLHLDLGPSPGGGRLRRRVRARLEEALRDAARTGRLAPGTRLPSSRALAADLGLARNTVAEVYAQLVAEGWLTARRGSGTAVADRPAASDPAVSPPGTGRAAGSGQVRAGPAGRAQAAPSRPGTWPPAMGAAATGPEAEPGRRPRYDLRPGSPDLSLFPRPGWLAAARRAVQAAPSDALGYADPRGRPELREALAGYLSRARGVRAHPDRIVVCAGFTQGLSLLSQVLRARGVTTLAIEACGQPSYREQVRASGLALALLPVDGAGAAVDRLPGSAAGAVLLTPAHQFPLGAVLAPQRRTQAIGWARDTGGVVIEDDYDGEFRYDRQPVGAMQALAPGQVVYAGSASKSLAPGLRLGWLALPAVLADEVAAARTLADRQGSAFDQLTLAEFIGSGQYDRQVRRARLAYRRRRDRLVATLRRHAPRLRVTGIAAGLHALLELPPGSVEDDLVARAARRGLAVEGLAQYCAPGHPRGPALVLGYGTPAEHAFTGALARLCAVLAE
jgi:GntR family transcriptional regulator / MocR family aminotransferase